MTAAAIMRCDQRPTQLARRDDLELARHAAEAQRNDTARRALNTMAMMLSSLAALAADCAPMNGNCFESECCADEGFSCYRRVGVMYAQCKPTVENCLDNAARAASS